MKSSEQTTEVKVRLYFLVSQFVKKYVHRYYKQFNGEVEDLINDYYVEFLTAKSREKGKEASLLDKFNSEITSLEYLVKIAVQRKLIDSSRQNPVNMIRIENFQDEYGDCIADAFGLVTTQDEVKGDIADFRTFTSVEVATIKAKFALLSEDIKENLTRQYFEMKSVLAPAYQAMFDMVMGEKEEIEEITTVELEVEGLGKCKCQQVTSKTACVLVDGIVLDFNRETGAARAKKYQGLKLTDTAVAWIKENIDIYHSGVARELFA